jgi:hypothetical protein|tara:strand:- start:23038 stop:23181 length:144 start_codon:yes stop_codon:yes gene_type:complete
MKNPKNYECKKCGKKYIGRNGWMNKHIIKTGHRSFNRITGFNMKEEK